MHEAILEVLAKLIANEIGRRRVPTAIRADQTLGELGLDSLHVVQLGLELEDRFEVNVSSTLFTERTTVGELLATMSTLIISAEAADASARAHTARIAVR